jgi:hypothetical protein
LIAGAQPFVGIVRLIAAFFHGANLPAPGRRCHRLGHFVERNKKPPEQ